MGKRHGLLLAVLLAGCGILGPPRSVTHPEGVRIERDIVFAEVDGEPLMLDLYTPEDAAGPLPAVVWIFGGGWRIGDRRKIVIAPLATRGYVVASIDYRLSDEAKFPAQIHDCKAGVRFLRANAARFGIDPERIAVFGPSAGGHLAALVGTTADEPRLEGGIGTTGVSSRVRAVVAFFPPTDLDRLYEEDVDSRMYYVIRKLLDGRPEEKPELAALASPVRYVSRDDPSFLFVHGRKDRFVPVSQSRILHEALREAGVDSELRVLEDEGHGNAILRRKDVQGWVNDFLDRKLKAEAKPRGTPTAPEPLHPRLR
jgi:acetyl esterase/lipase